MIDPDDKENVAYNYSYQKGKVLDYKNEVIDDDDLGCVTLSESEDEPCPDMGKLSLSGTDSELKQLVPIVVANYYFHMIPPKGFLSYVKPGKLLPPLASSNSC